MTDKEWTYLGNAKTTTSKDREPVVVSAPAANLFWADNQSGQSMDIKFLVDGKSTSSLPSNIDEGKIRLINTVDGTRNKLDMSINGQVHTLIENIPSVQHPNELKAAVIIGSPVADKPKELKTLFASSNNQGSDIEEHYPVILKVTGDTSLATDMIHNVNDISDEEIGVIMDSLKNNSFATITNEMAATGGIAVMYGKEWGYDQARLFLKDIMYQGKFSLRPVQQWGGGLALIFKGNHTSTRFLNAVKYALLNTKIDKVSTYFEISKKGFGDAVKTSAKEATPFKGGNVIGYIVAAGFNIQDFIKKDMTEQNFAELMANLGITFFKAWGAGLLGILFVGIWMPLAAPTLILIGTGVGATILVGMGLDWLDYKIGISNRISDTLKRAFPELTTSEIVKKQINENQKKIDNMIGAHAMHGSGMFGF